MSRHSGSLGLPTWVVDWSHVPLNHSPPLHGQLNHYKAGWPYPPASYKHKISANLTLTLRGFTFDNIKTLTHHTFRAEIPCDMLLTKSFNASKSHQIRRQQQEAMNSTRNSFIASASATSLTTTPPDPLTIKAYPTLSRPLAKPIIFQCRSQ